MKWPRRTKTNRFNSMPKRSKLPVPKSATSQIEAISEGGRKGTSLWRNPSSADQKEEGEKGAQRSSQIAMDSAARRNGGGLFEGLYRVIMRRNSVYVTFIIAGAFLGERVSCKILGFAITNSYFVRSFFQILFLRRNLSNQMKMNILWIFCWWTGIQVYVWFYDLGCPYLWFFCSLNNQGAEFACSRWNWKWRFVLISSYALMYMRLRVVG